MRRGHRTFRPNNNEDRHTCLILITGPLFIIAENIHAFAKRPVTITYSRRRRGEYHSVSVNVQVLRPSRSTMIGILSGRQRLAHVRLLHDRDYINAYRQSPCVYT